MLERHREQRVRVAVIERDVGRRAQHHEHTRRVDAPVGEHGRVGLEVRQVVLLLQARILLQLRRHRAVGLEALGRDRLGDDDARGGAASELMLEPRPLVVEGGRARNAEAPSRHRQLVRPVREREIEVAALRPGAQRLQPPAHLACLAEGRPSAVMADHGRLHPVRLDQLQRLRVVARGDLDLVTLRLEQLHERPEDERVGARGEVDPDAHGATVPAPT
jgi:hypothetical protein